MARKPLRRSRDHRVVAGVAGGMAEWLGTPVWLVRLLWLLAFLPGGVPGLLLYAICWIAMPSDRSRRAGSSGWTSFRR